MGNPGRSGVRSYVVMITRLRGCSGHRVPRTLPSAGVTWGTPLLVREKKASAPHLANYGAKWLVIRPMTASSSWMRAIWGRSSGGRIVRPTGRKTMRGRPGGKRTGAAGVIFAAVVLALTGLLPRESLAQPADDPAAGCLPVPPGEVCRDGDGISLTIRVTGSALYIVPWYSEKNGPSLNSPFFPEITRYVCVMDCDICPCILYACPRLSVSREHRYRGFLGK